MSQEMLDNAGEAIARSLIRATGIKPTGADLTRRDAFFERLARAVAGDSTSPGITDEAWEKLTIEAQDWVNTTVKSIGNPDLLIPDLKFDRLVPKRQLAPKGGVKGTRPTKRRNIWGGGTIVGEVAAILVAGKFEELDPSRIVVGVRERGVKASIESVDSAITDSLKVLAAIIDGGWIKEKAIEGLVRGVELRNDQL